MKKRSIEGFYDSLCTIVRVGRNEEKTARAMRENGRGTLDFGRTRREVGFNYELR